MFTDADLISSYSRAQALADGVLVAVDSKVAGSGLSLPAGPEAQAMATYVIEQFQSLTNARIAA